MDRIAELVGQLEPETAPPSPDARARQRAALAGSMAAADEARTRSPRRRLRHGGRFLAVVGAAAAAALVLLVDPGLVFSRTPPHPPVVAPGTSAVLTAVTEALAGTSGDVEEVRTTASLLSATSWVDLATGACRTDTAVGGRLASTVFVEGGRAVIIDYARRQWRAESTQGVTCEPLTPKTIEQDLAAGRYSLAGHATLDGQQALKLVSTTPTSGLHPVTKLTTLWVDATTYLPIQSTSTGHVAEKTVFTWLPATATNTAVFKIVVPAGFRRVATPPSRRPAP